MGLASLIDPDQYPTDDDVTLKPAFVLRFQGNIVEPLRRRADLTGVRGIKDTPAMRHNA